MFEPGHNLSKGRPKGSKNKATESLRAHILELLEGTHDQFLEDYASLTPAERINVRIKLLEFALPKLNRISVDVDDQRQQVVVCMTPAEMPAAQQA